MTSFSDGLLSFLVDSYNNFDTCAFGSISIYYHYQSSVNNDHNAFNVDGLSFNCPKLRVIEITNKK